MSLPVEPTGLTKTIPAYLYQEYADDDNVQALIDANNQLMQQYIDWFNQVGLPIYTGVMIVGPLLDWVANGLYGLYRPIFTTGKKTKKGPYNTYDFNGLAYNTSKTITTGSYTQATDDIFKRYLTWMTYLGDGKTFSTRWLKCRLVRFLTGPNGIDPGVVTTYQVSVVYTSNTAIKITLPSSNTSSSQLASLINQGTLNLPVDYTYTVIVS